MSKKVLLTGAGGAIGMHVLAHIMHNTDWEVVALDSFNREHKGYFDRITTVCFDHPTWPARIKIFVHDLNAPFTDREIEQIGEIDYILNLASRSDVQNSVNDPIPFAQNNTNIILHMLEFAWKSWRLREKDKILPEGKVFIHFSTDEVYGPAPKDSKGHPEWDVILPSNFYSASKAAQEAYAIAAWRNYGLPLIITNTMNNFGETQAPSKFPAMIQKSIESGEVIKVHASTSGEIGTRFYIHSRNTADALLFILRNVKPIIHRDGEIDRPVRLNIVGDKQVANDELVKIISDLMGKEAKTELTYFHADNPGHDLHYGLNGEELKALGWVSPQTFEESMKNTIEWQQRNPEWLKGE